MKDPERIQEFQEIRRSRRAAASENRETALLGNQVHPRPESHPAFMCMRFQIDRLRSRRAAFAVALVIAACPLRLAGSGPAPAGISVENGWVRWLPSGLPAAGYFTIANASAREAVLESVSSKDYAMVHLHETYTTPGGESGMRPVREIRIPAHGRVALAPGGYHLMLMGPRREIRPGDAVRIDLHFAGGENLKARLPVRPPGGNGGP